MKKTTLIGAIALVVLGCARKHDQSSILSLVLETSPNKLDPALVIDVAEGELCSMIFQGLVRFDPDGEVMPDLARSWLLDDTARRYTFRLDSAARFSDGTPVHASDVVYSFERVLAPQSRSSRQWVLDRIRGAKEFSNGEADHIAGLEAPDDSTLVIELGEPFRPFIEMLAMPAAYVVPRDVVTRGEDAFASAPVGSGRWLLAQWQRGDFLRLTPNPHFPGRPPDVSEVRFRIIPEAFTRIAEYESGNLDVLKIPLAELDRFRHDPTERRRLQSRPELRVVYIALNTTRGPFQDPRVRRALNMAVDVRRLIAVFTDSTAVRATGAVPPSLRGYRPRRANSFDPARARELLRAAGFANGFPMEIWLRDSPEGDRLVEAVQGYLREIGVDVVIVKREWSAFKEAVSQGRVDAAFLDWYADYPDAENFLFPLFHSENVGAGGNRAFLRNPSLDSLIERVQRSRDASSAAALCAEADSLAYDQAPWIYLYFPTTFVVVSPRVQGYVFPVLYLGEDFSRVRKL